MFSTNLVIEIINNTNQLVTAVTWSELLILIFHMMNTNHHE